MMLSKVSDLPRSARRPPAARGWHCRWTKAASRNLNVTTGCFAPC